MNKKRLIKELQRLEKYSKEKYMRYMEKSDEEWKYNCGIMYAIGWLTSALGIIEDYEQLNNLNDEEDM